MAGRDIASTPSAAAAGARQTPLGASTRSEPSWYPDRLLRGLLGWTLFTAALPTIIVYRAGAQPGYEWGLFGLTGVGASSAGYFVIVATAVLAWSVAILGNRGAGRACRALLLLWHGLVFASMVYGVMKFGSEMDVRGDAMGFRVNIALLGPLLTGGVLLASALWVWRHRADAAGTARWRRHSKILMVSAAIAGLAIIVLFRLGPGHPHQASDRVAILLVIAQVFLIAGAVAPDKSRAHV